MTASSRRPPDCFVNARSMDPAGCRPSAPVALQWGRQSPGSPACAGALELQPKFFSQLLVLCTWVKLLTDLHISDCELHKNAFGCWAHPDPLGEI